MDGNRYSLSNKLDLNETKNQFLSSSLNLLDKITSSNSNFNKSKYKSQSNVLMSNKINSLNSNKFHKLNRLNIYNHDNDNNNEPLNEEKLFIPNKNIKLSPLAKINNDKNSFIKTKSNNLNINQLKTTYNCLFMKDNKDNNLEIDLKLKNSTSIFNNYKANILVIKNNNSLDKIIDEVINKKYKCGNTMIEKIFRKLEHSIYSTYLILLIVDNKIKNKTSINKSDSISISNNNNKYTLRLEKVKGFCYLKNSEINSNLHKNLLDSDKIKVNIQNFFQHLEQHFQVLYKINDIISEIPGKCYSKIDNIFDIKLFLTDKDENFCKFFLNLNSIFNFGFLYGKLMKKASLKMFYYNFNQIYFSKIEKKTNINKAKISSFNTNINTKNTEVIKDIEVAEVSKVKIFNNQYKESFKIFDNLEGLINSQNNKSNKNNNSEFSKLRDLSKQKMNKLLTNYISKCKFINLNDLKSCMNILICYIRKIKLLQRRIKCFLKIKRDFITNNLPKIKLIQSKIRQM